MPDPTRAFDDLPEFRGADRGRRDFFVSRHPGNGHPRQRPTVGRHYAVQGAHALDRPLGHGGTLQRLFPVRATVLGTTLQILAGQHASCQGRECGGTDAELLQRVLEPAALDSSIDRIVTRLSYRAAGAGGARCRSTARRGRCRTRSRTGESNPQPSSREPGLGFPLALARPPSPSPPRRRRARALSPCLETAPLQLSRRQL